MPKYRVNGDIYNIPDDKAAAFEKRYPNATVDIYDNDGEEYTLPVSEKAGFQEQFKNWSYSAPSVPNAPSAPSSEKIDTGEKLGPVMPTPEAKDADGNIDWRETARQELEKSVPEAARPNSSNVQVPERPEATTAQEPATASAGKYVNAPITEDKQEVSLQQANREQVADLSSRIDDMLNQAQTASRDIYVQEQEEARKGGVLSTIANAIAASGHNPEGKMEGMSDAQQQTLKGATPELQQDIATLEAAKRAMSNAQEVIAEADKSAQEGKFDGFIKGVARGFGDKFFDVHTWDMGVSDTKESAELLRVLTKFDKGEPLSESEQMLLDAKSVELATNAYFGSYIGRGYKAGSVTAQSLPFMIEMAINPASTVGESAQSMLARYAMRRFGKKAIAKAAGIAGRAVGDIAGSAIMAGTTGSIHVAGDAIDRSTGDIKTDVDDGGRTVFVGHEDGESLGKAIAKAFTATAIENHSEMLGEYFSPVLGALGAAGRKVMNKVGLEKAVQFVDDVNASDLAKLINDFQKQTKWNGTIGEYAEEVAGNIENAILVGDQTLDTDSDTGVFNLSQNIDTFLGVSLMGGAFSVVRTAGYRTPKYRARKDMIKARDKAAELYGEERWKDIEDGLANAGDEGITEYLTDAILNETDPGKKAALLDYAGKIKAYEGTLKGNEKHREISGPEMTDLETSYENGYTLATPQEVNDAKMMFEYQQQRLRDNLNLDDIDIDDVLFGNEMGSLTDEQKSVAMDYLNAKATYDGVLDHVRDDLDTRVAAVTNAIDSHVNVDNGQIVTATLKQDDRKVYIIGGNVVMTPDGTMVDSQKSEKYIIIKDAETGQISSVDPTQILRLDGNLDPVKEKENARQQIMQTLARQEADKIDGVLPFNQGDTYQLTAEDGQSFPVQVVANEQGVIDNGDGTVNVVLNNDIDSTTGQPRITQMAKEQIQSMAEATNIARLQQHELQKAEERMRAAEEERTSRTQGAPYHINDRITITDAKTGELLNAEIVSEITDDGKYEVEVNTGDGEIVMMYLSPEELSQMNAQLVSAKIIDAEPEMVAQEQPEIAQSSTEIEQEQPEIEQETALSRIPVDKNGDAQFEEAQPSDTWKALVEMNEGDAAEAEDTAKQMYDNATKELDKAQKAKPKAGATVMEIQKNKAEYKSKLDKLQARVDYWGKVLSFPEAERKPAAIAAENAKTEAMQQANDNLAKGRKIMQEKGTYYKEDSKLGDYLNFEDFAMRMIANGRVKFVWKSDPNNSAIKGLGAHLGFEDNENERKRVFSILANADKGGLRPDEAAQELAEIYNSSNDNESIDTMQALDTILDIIRSYGGKTRDMMNAAIAAHANVGMDERGYMEDRQGNPINPDGTLYAESVSSIDEITDEDFTEPTRSIALPKIPENVDNAIGAKGKPVIIKKNIFKRNSQVHPEVSPQQAREILSSALYRPDLYGQNQKTSRPYNWIVISTKDSAGQNRLVVLEVNENKDNVEIIHWYNARNSSIEQIKRQAQKEGGLILILPSETEEAGGLSSRQSGLSPEGKDNAKITENQEGDGKIILIKGKKWETTAEPESYRSNTKKRANSHDIVWFIGNKRYGSTTAERDLIEAEAAEYGGYIGAWNAYEEDKILLGKNEAALLKKAAEHESANQTIEALSSNSSEKHLAENPNDLPDLLPTQENNTSSKDEGTNIFEESNIETEKPVAEQITEQRKVVNTEPTEAQKEAGNYRMGHVKIDGMDVTIENPKGSIRRGTDADGKEWQSEMHYDYGYIRGTKAVDNDHIDIFLSDNPETGNVFVVDQVNPKTGEFDESKVMYGFASEQEAREAYLSNYEEGWKGLGKITEVTKEEFKKWIDSSTRKTKPFSEYASVKATEAQKNVEFSISNGNGKAGTAEEKEFAEKYSVSQKYVEDYANGMRLGTGTGCGLALQNIRHDFRLANSTLKFAEFAHEYAKLKRELFDKFGDYDKLKAQQIAEAEARRDAMEAARKRIEEEQQRKKAEYEARIARYKGMSLDELDSEYFKALENKDEVSARDIVDEVARRNGYVDVSSDYQGVGAWAAPSRPGGYTDEERRASLETDSPDLSLEDISMGYTLQPDDIFDHPERYVQGDSTSKEAARAIKATLNALKKGNKDAKIKVFRAVPLSVKEGRLRNGDWVTPSRAYADMHGNHRLEGEYRVIEEEVPAKDLWWDGNDVREWGYDDGTARRYANVENNTKLNDVITRDDSGSIIPPSRRFDSGNADERYQISGMKAIDKSSEESRIAYEAVKEQLDRIGIPVELLSDQAMREMAINANALETVSSQNEYQQTVVSSASGAKIINNLDNLAKSLENEPKTKEKTFLGALAKALDAKKHGSNSQYATFEAKNGTVVTIRLANHNAATLTFDNHEENDGISIVVSARENNGITNDGKAHVTEFYYDAIKLRKADGKPLVDIVKSIKQSLYSGEYKDTTGLAQREEVNAKDVPDFMTVYHGSGAKFDRFDHSHMGEGEGNQAFGWGTYVTEVEGIGRTYAKAAAAKDGDLMSRYTSYIRDRMASGISFEAAKKELMERLEKIYEKQTDETLYANFRESFKKLKVLTERELPLRELYTVEIPEDINSALSKDEVLKGLDSIGKELFSGYGLNDAQINAMFGTTRQWYGFGRTATSDFFPLKDAFKTYGIDAETIDKRIHDEAMEDRRKNPAGYGQYLSWEKPLGEDGSNRFDGVISGVFEPLSKGVLELKTGKDIYNLLSRQYGSAQAASKKLEDLGYIGISYPAQYTSGGRSDGARNYVIFNENDAKITDRIEFLREPDGTVYGATVGGKIYLNRERLNPNTPIH